MSLQLVLGSSGSGKSYAMYEKMIKEAVKNKKHHYLILVPEQFTMQTQKDVLSMHPDHGIMNMDILSFLRLAYRVFDEIGGRQKPILNDMGKNMIVRKVIERKKEELTFFKTNVKKVGFVNELKSLLSELLQYSIEEEQIEEMIQIAKRSPMLQGKLQDVQIVYRGFKEYLMERYITTEEVLDVLSEAVANSKLIQNSVICFDGFTGFTPSQYELMGKLMKYAKKVYVTVAIDPREDISRHDMEHELFHMSKKAIHKLYQVADEKRITIEEPVWIYGDSKKIPYRFHQSKALASLEHNLFRYPYQTFQEEQDDISIHCCKDAMKEISYVTEEIFRLVKEENYRYREIAVVGGDISFYRTMIEKSFAKSEIPFFIDNKKDILSNPFVEWLRSLLEVIRRNYDYQSMFRYLRCGLIDIDKEEIDRVENYVLAVGIKGYKRWSEEWTRVYGRKKKIDLEELNQTREKIIFPLRQLKEELSDKKTVEEYTKVIYQFLVEQMIFEKLELYRQKFADESMPLLEKEYKQIYSLVLEILDQLVEVLGQEKVSLKEYGELLETGFSEGKVGLIPSGVDQVVVGDMERTRLNDIKALFIVGVNDGIVPKAIVKGGIISDMERELFNEQHIELAPTRRQSAYIEQFYLYLNLTKPKNRLYLTYAKVGCDGKSKNPSYLIGKIKQLFPKIEIQEQEYKEKTVVNLLGADKGVQYLLEGIRKYPYEDMPNSWKELFSYYFKKEDFRTKLIQLVEGAFYINQNNALSKAVANILYGKELHNNVTRLEQYAACAFSHFLAYGLELQERQEYTLKLPDMGNIFHNAIELFSKKIRERGILWHDITEDIRNTLAEESVYEATKDYGNTILFSSKRNEYMIKRVERMTKRTLWALCEHIKQGEFEPVGYEVAFEATDNLDTTSIKLSEEEFLRLQGRIDRVDTCEAEDETYIKVIDYKSGSTAFDMQKIYHGLQLQLVVYLNASIEIEQKRNPEKKVIPAGIFYYNIDDPIIDRPFGGAAEEEVRDILLRELKMNGLANDDKGILKKLDIALEKETGGKSQIIPVEFTAKGEIGARSQVASTINFQQLSKYVNKKVKQYGEEILDGTIISNPYSFESRKPCEYCKFQSICNFDPKMPGNEYRDLQKLDKKQIWEELKEDGMDQGTTEGN